MWIFSFYRILISLCAGAAAYLLTGKSLWMFFITAFMTRALWFTVEKLIERAAIEKNYSRHISRFKQEMGPYGIRLANKSEIDRAFKKSLSEVFTDDMKKLEKAVEQLEVMDTLFKTGMTPQGDDFLLHDLKLKYGRQRLNRG